MSNQKLTELASASAPVSSDLLYIVDASAGVSKKITIGGMTTPLQATKFFANTSAMVASDSIAIGDTVITQGYTSAGDGGAAPYLIVSASAGSGDGGFFHNLTGITGQAKLMHNGRVSVKWFGAVGDGTTDDTDALNAPFATQAPDNLTVDLVGSETYLQNGRIEIQSTNPTIIGHNATIKRGSAQTTTLTADATAGTTILAVATADALNISSSDQILLVNTGATNSGQANGEEAGPYTVDNVSANSISLTAGIALPTDGSLDGGGVWTSGLTVMKIFPQIREDEGGPFRIYETTFDGNRDNNTVHKGWTVNHCITRVSNNSIVDGCTFKNMPNECMFLGYWATVTNNTAYDLNGSFVHISSGQASSSDNHATCIIANNRIRDAGEAGPTINSHSEGVITFSNEAGKVVIEGNNVDGSTQGFIGQLGNTGEVTVTGNTARQCKGVIGFRASDDRFGDITINGNTFNTCGGLYITNNAATVHASAQGIEAVNITGNNFINCRIFAHSTTNLNISNNNFTWEDGYSPTSADFAMGEGNIAEAIYQVGVSNCLRYNVCNNTFEDYNAAVNEITTAIWFNVPNDYPGVPIMIDASTQSDYYYYNRDSNISGNSISNYANGIGHTSTRGGGDTGAVIGLTIASNTISLKDASASEWGIRGTPGAFISGNHIICGASTEDGIYLQGITSSVAGTVNGEMVIGNVVLGDPNQSIEVGSSQANSYNMTVINNITDKAITNDYDSQNTVSGNVQNQVTSTDLPLYASRANPSWY